MSDETRFTIAFVLISLAVFLIGCSITELRHRVEVIEARGAHHDPA